MTFFDTVERVLRERGVGLRVTGEEETERSKMKSAKVHILRSLREEMKAVARGERPAP
jgi:inorganic triphosphatase YgiF